jgi:SAM-dependent methyltransferase
MAQDIDHWTRNAADWIAWARAPGHDAFWAYRDAFAGFVGDGSGKALDIGCGEGRVSRLLGALGYDVTACDPVPEMVAAARGAGSAQTYHVASATDLPYPDGAFALTLLYNCLMDIEDAEAAMAEARRVTAPGGRVLVSIVHPIADLMTTWQEPGQPDVDYFSNRIFDAVDDNAGQRMHFFGWARPVSFYVQVLGSAGLTITRVVEPKPSDDPAFNRHAKWQRLPLFLWIEARTPK